MSYEYNQLLKRYGISTPELSYAGGEKPTDTESPEYQALMDKYLGDTEAYNTWLAEYRRRIGAFNPYGPGFQGEVLGSPVYMPEVLVAPKPAEDTVIDTAPVTPPANSSSGSDGYTGSSRGTQGVNDFSHTVQDAVNTPWGGAVVSTLGRLGLLGTMTQDPTNVSVRDADVRSVSDIAAGMHTAEDNALADFDSSQMDTSPEAADNALAGFDASQSSQDSSSNPGGMSANDGPGAADSSHDVDGNDGGYAKGGLVQMYNRYEGGGVAHDGLDLSKVTPEQLTFMLQEDPMALQRGIATFANRSAPEAPEEASQSFRSPQYERAASNFEKAQAQFNQLIQAQMDQKSEAPSRAEMYFKLAAAFGAPTKTGNFSESLGNASTVLGEHARETRLTKSADQAMRQKMGLEVSKMNLDSAQDMLSSERQLATEAQKYRRAEGKPQSEAGKIAMDSGLTPGTPAYNQFVTEYVTDKLETNKAFKEAMALAAAGNLANATTRTGLAEAANTRAETEAAMLTPKEAAEITKEQVALDAKKMLMRNLESAYQLSKTALPGSGVGRLTASVLGAVGHPDASVRDKEKLDQLLDQAALDYAARLKPMSDSDILFAQKLTGMRGTTGESRAGQIRQLFKQAADEVKQHEARIEATRSRKNRTRSTLAASVPTGEE